MNSLHGSPENHKWLSASDRVLAANEGGSTKQSKSFGESLRAIIRMWQLWGLMATRMLATPVWWFYVFWLPDYLGKGRGIGGATARLFADEGAWVVIAEITELAEETASEIGERPAIEHLRDWQLPGFTTGSGCIAPHLSQNLFEACARGEFETAGKLRESFIPLEDLRDAWNPGKVLHHATELAGIAETGLPVPYLSALSKAQLNELAPVAKTLIEGNLTAN